MTDLYLDDLENKLDAVIHEHIEKIHKDAGDVVLRQIYPMDLIYKHLTQFARGHEGDRREIIRGLEDLLNDIKSIDADT